ncbi:MAG: RtcB family protein [PVC group bacterium]|nr:RtcB family protein [PVC group bacterium]
MSVQIEKIDETKYRIPKTYKPGMLVDGIIYSDERLLPDLLKDKAVEQVANVAFLPGIVKHSLAMPDIHWGYGFPIGGVAATNIDKSGVISPGGVGFDINCGVRLLKTRLFYDEIRPKIDDLINSLYNYIPSGVGSRGNINLKGAEGKRILEKGAAWAVEKGFGTKQDLEHTEEKGQIKGANPDEISPRAYERGKTQAGTLGSGNHFLEIQRIDKIFDTEIASLLNLEKDQIMVMIHTGSRGFGHQVCTDHVKIMLNCLCKYGIEVPDRQLACAPVTSKEGKAYLGAMNCAANYAWANRQIIMHKTREVFEKVLRQSWEQMGMNLIYDVAHNMAKIETHIVDGKEMRLCVHRKGATRAFGPDNPTLPNRYKKMGQPVIIPGDMGRHSYLLAGTQKAMEETFGSTCHGAGRLKSRTQAIKTLDKRQIFNELKAKGIVIRTTGRDTIAEEAPQAYKDVNNVVDIVDNSGLARKICRVKPVGVIKG